MVRKELILTVLVAPILAGCAASPGQPEQSPPHDFYAPAAFFLLDPDFTILGSGRVGHAALLVSEPEECDYYSFAKDEWGKPSQQLHFSSLEAACKAEELKQYKSYLIWTTKDKSRIQAVREEAEGWFSNKVYHLRDRNCASMVLNAIKAGDFGLDDASFIPREAYERNRVKANGFGPWPPRPRPAAKFAKQTPSANVNEVDDAPLPAKIANPIYKPQATDVSLLKAVEQGGSK